jgi:hypothetical protein
MHPWSVHLKLSQDIQSNKTRKKTPNTRCLKNTFYLILVMLHNFTNIAYYEMVLKYILPFIFVNLSRMLYTSLTLLPSFVSCLCTYENTFSFSFWFCGFCPLCKLYLSTKFRKPLRVPYSLVISRNAYFCSWPVKMGPRAVSETSSVNSSHTVQNRQNQRTTFISRWKSKI